MAQGFENINFKINFQMGDRNAFASLKKELQEVKTLAASADFGLDQKELNSVLNSVNAIERAMTKAYDPQLNTVNIQKFNNLLKQSGTDINRVKDSLSIMGASGSTAFMKMTGQLMEINPVIKQTNSFLNDISKTLFNTIKYTVFNNLLSSISTIISQSYHYVKDLDRSLNDIRIVTGKSADEMERFAEQANDAAKSLAVTTKDYTQGSLIYYQQGLDDETVQTLTDITAKTSNVTQQSMSTVSEQLTAVQNGYQVANQAAEEGMQVYEEYVDKMAAVGAATASDLEELSTAMSKVASAASSMGVDFDDLNAQIATIVSVTRQAPESVGTALKTIYARLGDLKVDGVDEFGTKLGEVSAQLQTMGINITDQQGNMRDMSSVIAEVAEKWDTWTSAQRQAAAVAMAGKRQYNNLIALFDNQDMYGEALETSMNAAGTLEKQQEIALESIANKMDVLRATAEDLYDSLFDTDTIGDFIDAGTGVLQFLADFTDSVGGLNNILPMLGFSLTQLFSKQIAAGAEAIVTNITRIKDASILAKENMEQLKLVFSQSSFQSGENADGRQGAAFEQGIGQLSNLYSQIGQYQNMMNEQEKQNYDLLVKQQIQVNEQRNSLADMVTALEQAHNEYDLISKDTFKNAENAQLQLKEVNKVNEVVKILETTLDQMNRMEAKGTQSNFRFMLNGTTQGGLNPEAIKNYMAEIQKQFNLTEDAWRELTNSIDITDFSTAKKSFQALIEKLKETGASATEIEKITTEVERSQGTIDNFANAIGQQLNLRNFINNVTQGISAVGQLAMSINTLKNIGNIQDNDDLSAGDKVLQTILNLSFALSGLLNVIKNFDILTKSKQLIQGIAAGFELLTAKTLAHKAAQSVDNAVSSAGSWIQQRQVDNILKTVSAKQLDLIATNKNNVGLVRYNITKSVGNKLTEAQKNAITKGLIAKAAEKQATDKMTASQLKQNASILASPITQVIAGITALTATVLIAAKAYEKERKALIEKNEAQLEEIKSKQEVIKQNQEIANSFTDLYKEYKKTSEVTDQLKSATDKLIETYNIENAYLLARTENYKELNKILDETKEKELALAIDESEKGQKLAANNMMLKGAEGWFNSGSISGDIYTSTLTIDSGVKILQKQAERYEKTLQYVNKAFELKVNINDVEEVYDYYNLLSDIKAQYEEEFSSSELNDLESYKEINQQLKAMSESYEELEQQRNILLESKFEKTFLDEFKTLDEDSSLLSIYNKLEKIRSVFKDDFTDSELTSSLQKILAESGKFSDEIVNQVLIAQAFIDKHALLLNTDIDENEVFEAISKLNEKEIGFLALHLDSAVLSDDLEQQVNEHSEYFTQAESRQVSGGLRDFIGKYDTKKGFEEGAITSLYSSSDLVQEKTGLSEEQFNALDIDQQLQVATKGQIDFAKESNNAADSLKEDLVPQVEEAKNALDEQNHKSINTSLIIQDLIKDDTEFASKQNELEEALKKLSNQGFDNLNESDQQLIEDFSELSGVSIELLSTQGENLKTTQLLEAQYNDLQGQLDELVSSEVNFKEIMEKVAEVTKATNAIIDSIQAAYKSLIGIVDEYNETGKQSIDNVQTLMEMSDQYVAQLEFEGNTLSLNEEGFKALTLAKINDLIATENLAYEQKVLELAQIAESNSTDAAAQKTSLFAQMLQTLGLVSRETANDVLDLSAAIDLIGNKGSDETKAALDQATKAHQNRLKALEDLRNQINSSSGFGGLRDTMGISKKDSKSGGSSKDKKEDEKEQEDEFDRYWEIKKAIDAVDIALKKLDKDQENLYGYELINALKQENELLEQQAANYNTLYEMQQQEAAELREQLGAMGLMFDASGAITNYAAATSAALQQYAAAIEQYNAGLIDETTLKVYEKSYENFKKLLERYDKLYYTEMQQTQEKLDEIRRKELANNLKAWEVEIQIHLDKEKMKRDQNDFLKDIKQDFRKVFSDLTIDVKYDEKNFKSLVNDVQTTTKAIGDVEAEIDKMMAGGDSTMFESVSQAQEKLKELQEQLLDQGKALRELYNQVQETYLEGIDQVKDQFDELMSRYEKFNDELEFHKELIELLYGDKAYDLMDNYYETQTKNIEAQIDSLRKQADFQQNEFQKSYETAIKSGSKVNIDDFTTQTEDMKKAYENMIEAQGNLNDLVLEGVKILQDQYLNSINKIMDAMDKNVWGRDGFEGMKDNWEFMQKMADEYLDAVEGGAKIQLFANRMDIDKANASSLKAQQKIQAFREKEIEALREKENLTQADIDLAEARYQIMLKEIALEDAQNNKTSMKLTRNEQGNQSYQYVADEDDVGQKQQDLLQSYADLYKLADDSYNHSMELAFDLYEEMTEKIRALYEDTTLSEEERNQKILEIQDQYLPQIEAAAGNSELYKQEAMWATAGVFQTICDQDETAYETLTEKQKELVDSLRDKNFEDYDDMRTHLIEGFYPDLNTITEEVFKNMNINSQTTAAAVIDQQVKNPDSVKNEVNKAVSAMQGAIQEYEKELDKLQQIADMDFSKIGESIDKVSQKIDAMGGTTDKMVNNSSQYLDELRRALEAIADKQNSVIEQILAAQRAMQEYINLAAQARAASAAAQSPGGMGTGGYGGATGPGGDGSNNTKQPDTIKEKIISPTADGKQYTKYISEQGKVKIVRSDEGVDEHYKGELQPFKTGGYTGEQNSSDGRLAILHQKELVLNADDTENFLSGVKLIRDMTSLNGSINDAITNAVANMLFALNKTYSNYALTTTGKENITPNIFNITAEFPNANDVNEIREAILSLPNLASQYISQNTI